MKFGIVCATALFLASPVHAEVFKCNTPDGTVYSEEPCSSNTTALPQNHTAAPDVTELLLGTWLWNRDKVTYGRDGEGTYFRGETVCYKFSYTIQERVLATRADRIHACGASIEQNFNIISIDDSNLAMQHSVSGYLTNWRRERADTVAISPPSPAQTFEPTAPATQDWQPSGYAKLHDVAAVPYLTEAGRRGYREFLASTTPRAFIVCPNGNFTVIHGGSPTIFGKALSERTSGCEPYVINNDVVWTEK